MTSSPNPDPTAPNLLLEDVDIAHKRAAQLASLVPVVASGRHPQLLDLAIELADDLVSALSNLR